MHTILTCGRITSKKTSLRQRQFNRTIQHLQRQILRMFKIQIIITSPAALHNVVFLVDKVLSTNLANTLCVGRGEKME